MVQKLIGRYCQLLTAIIVICLALMVFMVFGNVVMRYAFNSGITVSEELSRWLFLWLIFLGASVAVHEQTHMGSDMVMEKLPPKLQKVGVVIGQLLMLWATFLILKGSWAQTAINWEVQAPVTEWSMAWVYSTGVVFAVGTGLMLLSDLWYTLRGQMTPTQIRKARHALERAEMERASTEAAQADIRNTSAK
ncbi:TRAP transporter small permease [Rhodoferax sp. U2-2l]|uniref:TRAP transporter small permease n=1 Tax=Rhodoferax sp. U2-2l TaxID=2884000 RepID=UPI001D0A17BC|nr:TRAP transporter small permease [Rhodoferax sp. U2-2l]MCB8747349.1 TRAP transporter small permease [Rhodoferax sp. U2-2l]